MFWEFIIAGGKSEKGEEEDTNSKANRPRSLLLFSRNSRNAVRAAREKAQR